ncbi:putative BTB/POZ domain containing protein [Blattamonas nauphoetae]|uniref:BTB/POZ domain containing protein n=1 Tax=Blattamonas nauphoetae TaxID=2049346 RepID=A0ABQ9XCN0_9EUKA|nr:putative BTB/POZ domain containing protein [Blattamonas nauphoetae]
MSEIQCDDGLTQELVNLYELQAKLEAEERELDQKMKQLEKFKAEQLERKKKPKQSAEFVEINVNGHIFATTVETLSKHPNSTLVQKLIHGERMPRDKEGRIYLDRNPKAFSRILDYLRTGHFPQIFQTPNDELAFTSELEYFQLQPTTTPFHTVWNPELIAPGLEITDGGKTITVIGEDQDHVAIIGDGKITSGTATVSVKVSIPRPNRYSIGVVSELPLNMNKGYGYKTGAIGWVLHDHSGCLGIYCQTQQVAPSTLGYSTQDIVTVTVDVDRGNLFFKVNGVRCAELRSCEVIKLGVYIAATLFNRGASWVILPE